MAGAADMTAARGSVSALLADWAAGLKPGDIPPEIRQLASTCLLDTIGVAIAGARGDAATFARALCIEGGTQGCCTALGTNRLFSAQAAAFVNATAAHALDFDDNCYAGFVHGSAVVVPATLAVGQKVNASGAEAVTAFAIAVECEYAVGAASQNVLYDQGWWTTGVFGPIGSSLAAARLLSLDGARTHAALGLAIVGAGGMKACFGTDAKALMAGRASEAGVVCAELAGRGATGPSQAIEDKNGFINLFNSGQFDHTVLDGLGKHWYLKTPGADIKRIPVCLSSHAAVDAVCELLTTHHPAVSEIEAIICDVPPIVRSNLKYDTPRSLREAQFSMPFAIAASLRFGALSLAQLNDESLRDPALLALMTRVTMITGPIWDEPGKRDSAPEGAHVSIRMRGGARFDAFRDKAQGSAVHPLSATQLADKFLACVTPSLGDRRAAQLLSNLKQLDSASKLREIFLDADFGGCP